jgi:DNA-binding response OmpR family regulator
MVFLIGWKTKRASKREPGPGMRASYEDLFKIAIGDFSFYPERQLLKHLSGSEELSSKESKLLKIFAESPNEIVDRDRLLKEVWEDEGVIVGRSLDVFVSKLRKRLQADETVKLVSVHGRGYKLEVQNQ